MISVALTSLVLSSLLIQDNLVPDGGVVPIRSSSDSMTFSGRTGRLDVAIPRIDRPAVRIDGRLDEAVWQQAALLNDFTQYEPVENIPATEATEVYVFFSSDAIYFGIRALDREPALIQARLGQRDRSATNDDWVRILLDTFDDQRRAYMFYVNPLGIQTDGLWLEGGGGGFRGGGGGGRSFDLSPDFIWESNGRVNDDGWSAEVRIPYVSLRFREVPLQQWGVQITREVKRRGFKQAWAPLTKDITSTLAQSGHLVGLRDLKARRLIEINPEATGQRVGSNATGPFVRDDFDPDFGVNGRIGLSQNLVLDATVNPDFSQIEADANQLTVNERFAIFFPEKRPFFLEGAEIFRTPRNLVHTRQIIDPSGGVKLSGKFGTFNMGYIGALDDSPRTFGDPTASRAAFNLMRVRRDVGRGSNVGLLYTDRTLTDGSQYNRVAAADARFLIDGKYTVTGQVAGTWTSDGSGAPVKMRPLTYVQVAKSGRSFSWNAHFEDVDPAFNTQTGFINRIGDVNTQGSVSLTKFGRPGALLERISVRTNFDAFFRHDEFWDGGSPFEAELQAFPTLSFRGGRSITFVLRDGYFRFHPSDYTTWGTLDASGNPQPFVLPEALKHMVALGIMPRARINNRMQLNGRLFYRDMPIFNEAARGLEIQGNGSLTIRPNSSVQLTLSHTFSSLKRERDNSQYSTSHLPRVRLQYQFSKSLFVRGLVQYRLTERSALQDPSTGLPLTIGGSTVDARSQGQFEGQLLAQYQPSPGTVVFIGYSRIMQGERTFRLSRLTPTSDGLFVKLGYLFRM
jgi:hypothetical protein